MRYVCSFIARLPSLVCYLYVLYSSFAMIILLVWVNGDVGEEVPLDVEESVVWVVEQC